LSAPRLAATSALVGITAQPQRPLRRLPSQAAIALLLALLAVLAWSSVAVPRIEARQVAAEQAEQTGAAIGDFALYALIHERVAAGEGYYSVAMDAQRAHNYPTRPFVTVRLPTLAWTNALLGPAMVRNLEMLLLLGVAGAFFVRMRASLGLPQAAGGAVLILLAGAAVMAEQAPSIHELAAGLLLSLAFVLYRADRLWPSLLAAALALAVRELALPFVLLWLAFAAWEKRWREAAAVGAVLALFAAGLAAHYLAVVAHGLPTDQASPGWQALVGPALPLYALARMSGLTLLPLWLAGPLGVLPLLGWAGLGGRTGWFALLWSAGFFLAMALFARTENFYWVLTVLPLYLAGFALVPRALGDLLAAATGRV